MTPADHGYTQCARCGIWMPGEYLTWVQDNSNTNLQRPACIDVAWCSAQAGWGKGAMEADTGKPADDAWTKGNVP